MSVPDAKFTKGEFQVGNPPNPQSLGMLCRSEFLGPVGSLVGWGWLSASQVGGLWLKTA